MIYRKKNGKEYSYYTRDDARREGIPFVYWKDLTENGWIVSDDDIVMEATVKEITERTSSRSIRVRRIISTGISRSFPHGKTPLYLLQNMEKRSYHTKPRYWYERHIDNKKLMRLLAMLVLTGKLRMNENRRYGREEYAQFVRLGLLFTKEEKFGWYKLRTLFNHERVRMAIQEEIDQVLKEENVNVKSVIKLILDAKQVAVSKNDPKAMIMVAVKLAELVGIDEYLNNKKKPRESLPDGGPDNLLPGAVETFKGVLNAPTPEHIEDAEVLL